MGAENDRVPPTKPTEQEQTHPVKLERTEASAVLKEQHQQPDGKLRVFGGPGGVNEAPEPEDPAVDESPGGLSRERSGRPKAQKDMTTSRALIEVLESNSNAHVEGVGPEEGLNSIPPNTSQLNYVPWETFQSLRSKENPFAIDVLVGEPEPIVAPPFDYMPQPLSAQAREGSAVPTAIRRTPSTPVALPSHHNQRSTTQEMPVSRGQAPLPERIRINSSAIIKLIYRISDDNHETYLQSKVVDPISDDATLPRLGLPQG